MDAAIILNLFFALFFCEVNKLFVFWYEAFSSIESRKKKKIRFVPPRNSTACKSRLKCQQCWCCCYQFHHLWTKKQMRNEVFDLQIFISVQVKPLCLSDLEKLLNSAKWFHKSLCKSGKFYGFSGSLSISIMRLNRSEINKSESH